MNLELNLENKVITNPNLEQYTQAPITIDGDDITLGYLGNVSTHGHVDMRILKPLNKLYDYSET